VVSTIATPILAQMFVFDKVAGEERMPASSSAMNVDSYCCNKEEHDEALEVGGKGVEVK